MWYIAARQYVASDGTLAAVIKGLPQGNSAIPAVYLYKKQLFCGICPRSESYPLNLEKSVDDMDPSLFNGVIMHQRLETK